MGTIDKNINGYEEKRHTLQRKRLTIRHSTGAIKRKFQSNFSKTNTPTHRVKTKQKRLETPTVETSEHIVRHEIKNTEHLQFASVVAAHKALSHIVDDDPSIKTRRALEKQAREQLSYYMISRNITGS